MQLEYKPQEGHKLCLFSSLLHPQRLEQCLAHSWCKVRFLLIGGKKWKEEGTDGPWELGIISVNRRDTEKSPKITQPISEAKIYPNVWLQNFSGFLYMFQPHLWLL